MGDDSNYWELELERVESAERWDIDEILADTGSGAERTWGRAYRYQHPGAPDGKSYMAHFLGDDEGYRLTAGELAAHDESEEIEFFRTLTEAEQWIRTRAADEWREQLALQRSQ